MARNWSNTVL